MKRILFCFITISALFYAIFTQAQNKIHGIYESPSSCQLEITKDSMLLLLLYPNSGFPFNDTLAFAKIKRVSKDFIELNSVLDAESKLFFSMRESITQDSLLMANTTNIKFRLSNVAYEKFFIRVYIDDAILGKKTYSLIYNDKNQNIQIPERVKSFHFDLSPCNSGNFDLNGLYQGIKSFSPAKEFFLGDNANTIEINIPGMNDAFFYRYYFMGDYARLINKGIIFKGITYKKVK